MQKVTIGVILFGTKYLKESLPSLINQDYTDIEYIFRDQEEGKWSAYELIKSEMPEIFKRARVIKEKNLFHSGGHNKCIQEMKGDFYVCASNDMLYPENLVTKIIEALNERPTYSVATCKIMRWDYDNKKKTNFIDSLGLAITPHHHFHDIAQGHEDEGQFSTIREIFGATGALAIYSRKALQSIRFENQYFDELLHYKNDVDLSYRLRWAHQKTLLVHNVQVYHDRQAAADSKKSSFTIKSSFIGDKILLRKNFTSKFPLSIKIRTRLYHFAKTCYLIALHPTLLPALLHLRKLRTEIAKKRQVIDHSHIKNITKFMKS